MAIPTRQGQRLASKDGTQQGERASALQRPRAGAKRAWNARRFHIGRLRFCLGHEEDSLLRGFAGFGSEAVAKKETVPLEPSKNPIRVKVERGQSPFSQQLLR